MEHGQPSNDRQLPLRDRVTGMRPFIGSLVVSATLCCIGHQVGTAQSADSQMVEAQISFDTDNDNKDHDTRFNACLEYKASSEPDPPPVEISCTGMITTYE